MIDGFILAALQAKSPETLLAMIGEEYDSLTHRQHLFAHVEVWKADRAYIEALERERDAWKDAALAQAKALGAARVLDDKEWGTMPVFVKAAQALDAALATTIVTSSDQNSSSRQGEGMTERTPEVSMADTLRHIADDHACCRGSLLAAVALLEALEEALRLARRHIASDTSPRHPEVQLSLLAHIDAALAAKTAKKDYPRPDEDGAL